MKNNLIYNGDNYTISPVPNSIKYHRNTYTCGLFEINIDSNMLPDMIRNNSIISNYLNQVGISVDALLDACVFKLYIQEANKENSYDDTFMKVSFIEFPVYKGYIYDILETFIYVYNKIKLPEFTQEVYNELKKIIDEYNVFLSNISKKYFEEVLNK